MLEAIVFGFYGVLAVASIAILWRVRYTPFDRAVRQFPVPKADKTAELHLGSSSDVGVV